jgi:hypothetical protein
LSSRKFSYSTLLPFANLFACYWFVLAAMAAGYLRLHTSSLIYPLRTVSDEHFRLLEAWNFPGVLLGLPITIPVTSTLQHSPSPSIDTVWAAFTSPIFCMPVWWFVGRGLNAALTGTRPHLAMRIMGTTLFAIALAGAIAIVVAMDSIDFKPTILAGTVFWTAAFGIFPAI